MANAAWLCLGGSCGPLRDWHTLSRPQPHARDAAPAHSPSRGFYGATQQMVRCVAVTYPLQSSAVEMDETVVHPAYVVHQPSS